MNSHSSSDYILDSNEKSDSDTARNVQSMQTSINSFCDLPDEPEYQLSEIDKEEKQRLISQILELQHTLDDLSSRVESVKVDNQKLRSENQVLGQYIENLMAASSVFQSTSPNLSSRNKGYGGVQLTS